LRRPALGSVLVAVVAVREGHHFDAGEHIVFDLDRLDSALLVGLDEEDPAAVPEILAIFFAGFDVQFQSLSCHCLILALACFDEHGESGHKGDVSG